MRIVVNFTKNTEPVQFNYLSNLNGYLHKVLGKGNEYHDKLSIYSTSFLHGGKRDEKTNTLNFSNGASWYVSSPDMKFIKEFIENLYKNIDFSFGMKLESAHKIDPNIKKIRNYFYLKSKSPILLKERNGETNKTKYYTYNDNFLHTSDIMKKIIIKKAEDAKFVLNKSDFEIYFDHQYSNKKIKNINIKSINNTCSVCPIIIKTEDENVIKFITDVGVGHSTGSGFGCIG